MSAGVPFTFKSGLTEAPRPWFHVLFAPRGAFSQRKQSPRGVWFLLAMSLLAVAPAAVFVTRVDMQQVVVKELKRSGQYEKIPAAQRDQAIAIGVKITKVGAPLAAAVQRAMWIMAVTLIAFALFRAASADLKLSQCLAAAALGAFPLALKDAALTALFTLGDPQAFDPDNPLLSNPAAWLGMDTRTSVVAALLASVDLFTIWTVVVTGIGLNVVRGKRGPGGVLVPAGVAVAFAALAMMKAAAAGMI